MAKLFTICVLVVLALALVFQGVNSQGGGHGQCRTREARRCTDACLRVATYNIENVYGTWNNERCEEGDDGYDCDVRENCCCCAREYDDRKNCQSYQQWENNSNNQ